ncbi:MAG: hypothetical protein ACREQZ_15705 [Woeseiaceae bacterium]
MNTTVQVDLDQVRAELADIEAEHPDAPAQPEPVVEVLPPEPPRAPPDWSMAALGVVGIFDRVVAPNWNLEPGEKEALFESTKQVLVAFFPDPLDPRVQACFALGGTMFAIAQARHDPATGKVRPLRAKKSAPKPDDGAASRVSA